MNKKIKRDFVLIFFIFLALAAIINYVLCAVQEKMTSRIMAEKSPVEIKSENKTAPSPIQPSLKISESYQAEVFDTTSYKTEGKVDKTEKPLGPIIPSLKLEDKHLSDIIWVKRDEARNHFQTGNSLPLPLNAEIYGGQAWKDNIQFIKVNSHTGQTNLPNTFLANRNQVSYTSQTLKTIPPALLELPSQGHKIQLADGSIAYSNDIANSQYFLN